VARVPRLAILIAACVVLAGPVLATVAHAEVVDRVVLRVNDRIATLLDYEKRRAGAVSELQARDDVDPEQRQRMLEDVGNRVFRKIFEDLLLLSRADQLSIHPEESEVDAGVRQIRQGFGIESDDEFAAALSQEGMSLAEFREQVRDQIRIRQVVGREVSAKIELEEDDLRRVYRAEQDRFVTPKRWRVHELIVLEDEEADPAAVRRLAEGIRGQILGGRAIDEVAAEYSKEGKTSDLVDLGWVSEGELDPQLESSLVTLSPGELSEPIEARGGYHLLEVEELEDARAQPFSEVSDQIEARERRRQFSQKFQEYMRDLEKQAYVVADPPADAAGFRTVAGDREDVDPYAAFESESDAAADQKEETPVREAPVVEPDAEKPEPPPR
jgi:parvulin-like peptidyl-prolyl isomerase